MKVRVAIIIIVNDKQTRGVSTDQLAELLVHANHVGSRITSAGGTCPEDPDQ